MFVRLKTADSEVNVNSDFIESFVPAEGETGGSVVSLTSGEQFTVKETNRKIRSLLAGEKPEAAAE